jgi:hypothetical protein
MDATTEVAGKQVCVGSDDEMTNPASFGRLRADKQGRLNPLLQQKRETDVGMQRRQF